MNEVAKSGSSVRPQRLYKAFLDLGIDVKLISGIGNKKNIRKNAVKDALEYLKEETPDICYIEPPSGPLFFNCDRKLIKLLYKKEIPIGLFYRDAYWKFPEFAGKNISKSFVDKVKEIIIRVMQQRDYKLYKKCCSKVYFPTELMASYFDFPDKSELPPGCFVPENTEINEKKDEIVTAIYVGGATKRYGLPLIINSVKLLNNNNIKIHIKVVCSEKSWNDFKAENRNLFEKDLNCIEVLHLSGAELSRHYMLSDFGIIPLQKNEYNDFAFPIKLSEYLSYQLPIVTTDCTETADFVSENDIGIIAKDNEKDFAEALLKMATDSKLRNQYKINCIKARNDNLWITRAEKVINDLIIDKEDR